MSAPVPPEQCITGNGLRWRVVDPGKCESPDTRLRQTIVESPAGKVHTASLTRGTLLMLGRGLPGASTVQLSCVPMLYRWIVQLSWRVQLSQKLPPAETFARSERKGVQVNEVVFR